MTFLLSLQERIQAEKKKNGKMSSTKDGKFHSLSLQVDGKSTEVYACYIFLFPVLSLENCIYSLLKSSFLVCQSAFLMYKMWLISYLSKCFFR